MRYYGNFKISEQIYFLSLMKTSKFWKTSKLSQIKTYHYQFQKKYNPSQNILELFYLLF